MEGFRDGRRIVRVHASAQGGRATSEVCRLLAKYYGVPKSAVSVVSGKTSRRKRMLVEGVENKRDLMNRASN